MLAARAVADRTTAIGLRRHLDREGGGRRVDETEAMISTKLRLRGRALRRVTLGAVCVLTLATCAPILVTQPAPRQVAEVDAEPVEPQPAADPADAGELDVPAAPPQAAPAPPPESVTPLDHDDRLTDDEVVADDVPDDGDDPDAGEVDPGVTDDAPTRTRDITTITEPVHSDLLFGSARVGGEVQQFHDPTREPEEIVVQRPTILLDGATDDAIEAVLATEAVTRATSVQLGTLELVSPGGIDTSTGGEGDATEGASIPVDAGEAEGGPTTIDVAVIDVAGFRPLTPQVTAESDDVWARVAEGDAAFTHDIGTRLGLELGTRVPAGPDDHTIRVGAFASNGAPPVADAVISQHTADRLRVDGSPALLLATAEGTDLHALAERLGAETGSTARVLPSPQERQAFLTGAAAQDAFEPFTYVSLGDGMISIDPEWVQRNIVSAQVPVFRGHVTCHKDMIPQLEGALNEIVDRELDHLIDPSQYGGCWVPRHILFNPNRALSMHAWGLAIDFNVAGNEYGNPNPTMDRRIVEIFERWGFAWGGHWSTPDGMHFELNALLR